MSEEIPLSISKELDKVYEDFRKKNAGHEVVVLRLDGMMPELLQQRVENAIQNYKVTGECLKHFKAMPKAADKSLENKKVEYRDKKTGEKLYPVGSWQEHQHKFYNNYDRKSIAVYDDPSDKNYEALEHAQEMLDKFDSSPQHGGIVYAKYEDYKAMREVIDEYDHRHWVRETTKSSEPWKPKANNGEKSQTKSKNRDGEMPR